MRLGMCALLIPLTYPTLASAQQDVPAPPLQFRCYIEMSRGYVQPYRGIHIIFTNEGTVPADEVHFTVRYAGRTEHPVDKGIFSPHVRIDHAYPGFHNMLWRSLLPDSCTVDYVHFTDGSA